MSVPTVSPNCANTVRVTGFAAADSLRDVNPSFAPPPETSAAVVISNEGLTPYGAKRTPRTTGTATDSSEKFVFAGEAAVVNVVPPTVCVINASAPSLVMPLKINFSCASRLSRHHQQL